MTIEEVRLNTLHEVRFIENIGRNKFGSMFITDDRRTLLMKYIRAVEKRVDWENIDKDIVLSTAKKLLREV
jgi:hypothetical protein